MTTHKLVDGLDVFDGKTHVIWAKLQVSGHIQDDLHFPILMKAGRKPKQSVESLQLVQRLTKCLFFPCNINHHLYKFSFLSAVPCRVRFYLKVYWKVRKNKCLCLL